MPRLRDMAIGIAILAVIFIIIVPPPTWLVDFLLMINIGLAIIILMNAVYSKEPLDMALFPTILLFTTVFRVALSFSTTRLILGTGYGGRVVQTFGNFVAGGNMIVGAILFTIIVLVNFMVITRGSERVAEVTARFTLDAMPGKQMAIDADLNTGLINDEEAKSRRKKIQDEANFFGAMDGAAKFVKGDAIAGILIVFIDLIGGVALGATGAATGDALPVMDALGVYGLMTIGDGLVGIVPSLLISVATGMLVTKATSDSDISSTVVKQLFSNPVVLYIGGAALIVLSVFTRGLPWYFFIPAGAAVMFMGYRTGRVRELAGIETELTQEDQGAEDVRKPENVVSLLNVDPIILFFGYGLIPLIESSQGGDLIDRVVMIRRQIALEYGAIVPVIHLRDDIKLAPSEYRIQIKGVDVAGGDIMFDHYMAMNPGYVEEEIDGIETVEPYLGLPAIWISESQRERAEALGYTVVDPPAIIATHMTEVIRAHLHELLTRQTVQTLVNNIKEANSVLIDELIPKLLSIGDIQKVLANLLREGVSIRDLPSILEALADYAAVTRDTDMLTEYVRQTLKRSISKKYFSGDVNTVVTLDPELEQQIMSSIQQTEQGSYLALDPKTTQQVFDKLNAEVAKLTGMGLQPIVLTSPIIRLYFKRLVEPISPDLVVLSYNELEPSAEIRSVGMVSVA